MFSKPKIQVRASDDTFEVELANSFISKFLGFRFCSEGKMMFSFPGETTALIDMMLVLEPLYLYFIDSNKQVVEVQKADPWTWNPRTWRFYRPEKPYRYLLESFEEIDLAEGDQLEFEV
jgi:uncharacterized membrane protein (UPF0127 family)